MGLYSLDSPPSLSDPVLVIALSGWVDAGEAGTGAADVLAESSTHVVSFDADALYDYRANRPVLRIADGSVNEITWPALELRLARHDGVDVLTLTGIEPDFRWQQLAGDVAELVRTLAVTSVVSLGAVPAATPHTAPVPVLTTTSDTALLRPGDELLQGTLVVPGAAVSIITDAVVAAGVPVIGYWAQVPHYVRETFYPAVAALVRKAETQLGVAIDLAQTDEQAQRQIDKLDEIVAGRPEAAAYLERLEELTGDGLPSADEIGAEVERFLQDQGDEGPFG